MTPQMEPAAFAPAVRLILEADEIDGAIAIDIGLDLPAYGQALAEAHAATGKPVVACTADTPEVDARLRGAGIPVFATPERAVRAYRALRARASAPPLRAPARRPARPLPEPLGDALGRAAGPLPYDVSRAILEHAGVAFPKDGVAGSVEEACSIASRLGYPVVVKTARADVLHKTDAGGVVLNVGDEAALREAWRHLAGRFGVAPVLVQQQVAPGIEILVGGRRDPVFGPVVVCGLGGVFAELWRDVSLRLAPLAEPDALAMLREGRKAVLLRGVRGMPPADERTLTAVLIGLGDLIERHPEIVELDVNPLIVRGEQVVAVDAVVIVDRTPEGGHS
jgi:acyl-CoA synthetase (NDP forming)